MITQLPGAVGHSGDRRRVGRSSLDLSGAGVRVERVGRIKPNFTASVNACRQTLRQLSTVNGAYRSSSLDYHAVIVSAPTSTTRRLPMSSAR